jgi:hypothetical protein
MIYEIFHKVKTDKIILLTGGFLSSILLFQLKLSLVG